MRRREIRFLEIARRGVAVSHITIALERIAGF